MADRGSARLFAQLFTELAARPITAEFLWQLTQKYDFAPCQMQVVHALVTLGLARREGEDIIYKGDPEWTT